MKYFGQLSIVLVFSCMIFPGYAHAYLDAGTGSAIIQMIIAVFLGGLCAIKIFWNKIKTFYGKLFSRKNNQGTSED